jgi:hypothetical protein
MKYIKKYENINSDLKVGDYVLIKSTFSIEKLKDFINKTIGQITQIDIDNIVYVKYTKIPFELIQYFDANGGRYFQNKQIIEFDKDIEKLKLKIDSKKYNI